jgi:hypothetical protein
MEVRRKMLIEPIDAAIVQAHHLQVNEADFLGLVKERLEIFAQNSGPNSQGGKA